MLGRHRLVDLAPVDRVFGGRVADDELVLDAAPGELAGIDQQRAVLGQRPSPRATACSTSGAVVRFQWILARGLDALRVKPALRDPVGHFVCSFRLNNEAAAAGRACRRIMCLAPITANVPPRSKRSWQSARLVPPLARWLSPLRRNARSGTAVSGE